MKKGLSAFFQTGKYTSLRTIPMQLYFLGEMIWQGN